MKQEWKGWLRLGVTLFGLYLAVHYWVPFCRVAGLALRAAVPLILGAVIAYAVNILMSMYERAFFPNSASPALKKADALCAFCWPTPAWWPSCF